MKRTLCTVLVAITGVLVMQHVAFAQQTWTWEYYGISIDFPDGFQVVKNTENEFEANGNEMSFYMYIFEEDIAAEDMENATLQVASEMELEELDDVQAIQTRSFEGMYVAGYREGVAILLCGLIDPSTSTNFFVVIAFNDEDMNAEEAAFTMLDSIRKN